MLAVQRFTTQDLQIDEAIRAGERLWLSWASANRDPSRFTNPDTFDPQRTDTSGHLAFGHGTHYCPGASLARLENDIAVTSLVHRFPELSLGVAVSDVSWTASLRSRSLSELPVSL